MKSILITLLALLMFVNCNKHHESSNNIKLNDINKDNIKIEDITKADVVKTYVSKTPVHPGKKLMEVHCNVCHHPTTSEENRTAPPMIAVKMRYINSATSKKEFIASMQNWIKNPVESNVKMYGAVKRFGIMSKLPYPERVIEQIADYMYDNAIEQPDWFEEHYNQNKSNFSN